jgi:molybdopterin synthase sulfur carrier subunit
MSVLVQLSAQLCDHCGSPPELRVAAASVRAALAEIERGQPRLHASVCDETGAVRRNVNLFVGGKHIRDLGGLDATLAPGDVVTIIQAVSGG